MGAKENSSAASSYILFPVQQKNGNTVYYATDYSEELGISVYKGYLCELVTDKAILTPCRIKKEEMRIDTTRPVAIKFYDVAQHPSPYQFYTSEIAVLNVEGKDVLIMDFIEGFHIHPDAKNNPQLKQLSFVQSVDIIWQLILGLNHLHYRNTSGPAIVHGDVKGENIKIRIKEQEAGEQKGNKIDVFYLDADYAKPITSRPQCAQGTPEHLAIELLEGYYSEGSDFFALSPLLLSVLGARNPLQKIIEYRNSHPDMCEAELVKKYRNIGFCTEGIFEHFEKKPAPFICKLVERFIVQMGAKNPKNRPQPDAILEFFTALRQLCLISDLHENTDIYIIRLCIAANDEIWLKESKYQALFIDADENLQDRLIALMSVNQLTQLYKVIKDQQQMSPLIAKIRKNIAHHLAEKSEALEKTSLISSLFFSPVTPKEVHWLLQCYEQEDSAKFNCPTKEKMREKLKHCSEGNIASLITIVADGLINQSATDQSAQKQVH